MSIELFFEKDKGTYVIRNGMFRTNCVVDNITISELDRLWHRINIMVRGQKREAYKKKKKI